MGAFDDGSSLGRGGGELRNTIWLSIRFRAGSVKGYLRDYRWGNYYLYGWANGQYIDYAAAAQRATTRRSPMT